MVLRRNILLEIKYNRAYIHPTPLRAGMDEDCMLPHTHMLTSTSLRLVDIKRFLQQQRRDPRVEDHGGNPRLRRHRLDQQQFRWVRAYHLRVSVICLFSPQTHNVNTKNHVCELYILPNYIHYWDFDLMLTAVGIINNCTIPARFFATFAAWMACEPTRPYCRISFSLFLACLLFGVFFTLSSLSFYVHINLETSRIDTRGTLNMGVLHLGHLRYRFPVNRFFPLRPPLRFLRSTNTNVVGNTGTAANGVDDDIKESCFTTESDRSPVC